MSSFVNVKVATDSNSRALGASTKYAQSWTASAAGEEVGSGAFGTLPTTIGFTHVCKLEQVSVLISNTSGSAQNVTLDVYDNELDNGVSLANYAPSKLSSATASVPNTGASPYGIVFAGFNPKVRVVSGSKYTLVVSCNSSDVKVHDGGNIYSEGTGMTVSGDTISHDSLDLAFAIELAGWTGASNGGLPRSRILDGGFYNLPNSNSHFCLFDTMDPTDRLIVNAKLHLRKSGKAFARYIWIYYNGEEICVKLPSCEMQIIDNSFAIDASQEKLKWNPQQRYNSPAIKEIRRNSKEKVFLLTTNTFGTFHLVFSKNKFKFYLKGNTEQFKSTAAGGCMLGPSNHVDIPWLNNISPLP